MGGTAVEDDLEARRMRRAEDDLADGRRLVVDVADARVEPAAVELANSDEADLLSRREDELDSGMRPPVLDEPPGRAQHRDDRRLVVGSENRAGGVADDALLDDRFDRAVGRNRVEMGTQEQRHSVARRRQPRVEVSRRVLVDREPERPQLRRNAIRDGPLFARRTRQRGELEEEIEDGDGPILGNGDGSGCDATQHPQETRPRA